MKSLFNVVSVVVGAYAAAVETLAEELVASDLGGKMTAFYKEAVISIAQTDLPAAVARYEGSIKKLSKVFEGVGEEIAQTSKIPEVAGAMAAVEAQMAGAKSSVAAEMN